MNYLLDTNVVSEWVKPRPDGRVVRWLAHADEDRVFLSVITFGEIRLGIEAMAAGHRREALNSWLEDDLSLRFEGRILSVDLAVADTWGLLMSKSNRMGVNLGAMDGLLAAVALTHGLTLATRNTKHFQGLGVNLLNPWVARP